MKNRMHHLTAFLLCVVLSFTMIFSADAAVLDNTPQNDSLTWKVENNTLTISGTGPMTDYDYLLSDPNAEGRQTIKGSTAPWDKEKFTRVVVEEGITSIGNTAFYNKSDVTEAILPESLLYIGSKAFENTGLSRITIPGSVQRIGYWAFGYCINLKEITLPESLTVIDSRAFMDCIRLEHINLPASVQKIGSEAFKDCSALKSVTVAEGSYAEQYCVDNGLPYDYGDGSPVHAPTGNLNITWKVENKTLTISGTGDMDDYAALMAVHPSDNNYEYMGSSSPWYEEDFNRVVVEEGITSIGAYTFNNKRYLLSVTLPESLVTIGECAFAGCQSLEEINLPDSVSEIGQKSFLLCSGLKEIPLPASVTKIPFGAFIACFGLTEFTVPDSVVSIDMYAFQQCKNLETVTIPASVTEIGERVFDKCESLKTVIVEKGSYAEKYCLENNLPVSYAD